VSRANRSDRSPNRSLSYQTASSPVGGVILGDEMDGGMIRANGKMVGG
jgi:hypothetical protein